MRAWIGGFASLTGPARRQAAEGLLKRLNPLSEAWRQDSEEAEG